MKVSIKKDNSHNPALLEYRKPKHGGEIIFAVIAVLIMLFPLIVDVGHPAPIIGMESVGVLFLMVAVAVFADAEIKHKKVQKAIRGNKYTAVVTAVHHRIKSTRNSSHYNRIHLYCTECEFTHPETNEKFLLTSRYVLYNLSGTEGRTVDVYFDSDDMTNYFVDLTVLAQED